MPELSILIVNFNTRELLQDCLRSIAQDEGVQAEIIVVDNASRDGSAAMVRADFPQVCVLENDENEGFAKANNRAIARAGGQYLLLLNSDTVVHPGALQVMTDFLAAHPRAGAVTCRLLDADGSVQACVSGTPGPILLLFRLCGVSRIFRDQRLRQRARQAAGFFLGSTIRSYLDPYVSQSPAQVENISGACLMLRREAIEQVGLLDESYFMYFEDMDYCLRLRQAGWKLYYLPEGEIVHLVGRSSSGRMRDFSLHSYRSLFALYRRHFPPRTLAVVRLLVLLSSSLRWLWNLVAGSFTNSSICRQNRQDLQSVIRLCLE
jgi:GT2 family glycosyltransferase